MAYDTSIAVPNLVGDQPIAGQKSWVYNSSHDRATVVAAGFITDFKQRGANIGDMVQVGELSVASGGSSDMARVSVHRVTVLGSTTATLSAGVLVSSAS